MMDPRFQTLSQEEKEAELRNKSETETKMESMIEKIKLYQAEYSS